MKAQFLYTSTFFVLMILLCSFLPNKVVAQSEDKSEKTLRLGVIGLVHDHVSWIFNRTKKDVSIVGIVETDSNKKNPNHGGKTHGNNL